MYTCKTVILNIPEREQEQKMNNDILTVRAHIGVIYNYKSSVLSKKYVCKFIFSHQLSWSFTLKCFHPEESHVVYHNCLLIFLECVEYLSTRAV